MISTVTKLIVVCFKKDRIALPDLLNTSCYATFDKMITCMDFTNKGLSQKSLLSDLYITNES